MSAQHPAEYDAAVAYTVECPRCGAAAGDPCRERYCRNGYEGCTYAVCSRVRDLPEPHVARVARAATRVIEGPVGAFIEFPTPSGEGNGS